MILFIHGFKSCGLGNKSKALIDFFGLDNKCIDGYGWSHCRRQSYKSRIDKERV